MEIQLKTQENQNESARRTETGDSTYKIRVDVETLINHFKNSFCVAGRKTQKNKESRLRDSPPAAGRFSDIFRAAAVRSCPEGFYVIGRTFLLHEKTLHADLLLSGIAQLVTVIVTDKIHQHKYIRSLKPLIA